MNKREDELIAETFHTDWATGAASAYAEQAARYARVRRGRRRVIITACVIVAAAVPVLWPISSHQRIALRRSATVQPRGYQIISDAELLAQVRDRPLLALRDGDHIRQIVVLTNE